MASRTVTATTDDDLAIEKAVVELWTELDNVVGLCMMLVDLIAVTNEQGQRLNHENLRKATAKKLRAAIEKRNEVLATLGIDADEVGEKLGEVTL